VNIDKSGMISVEVLPGSLIPLPNILTKPCRGKVMKEKLNCVKVGSSFFIHHSSFCESLAFAPPNLSFDRAKHHVSSPQTYPLARRNDTFRPTKPYLSQI